MPVALGGCPQTPDWLAAVADHDAALALPTLIGRLAVALLFGVGVAAVYRGSHGRGHRDASAMVTTLVLLAVLIAMVSMVIGNSVARAFSLVGALSIVRFRTVVEDTRDTAFVIFAVVVGMASGVGLLLVPLVGIPIVAVAAVGLSRWPRRPPPPVLPPAWRLIVRVGLGRDPQVLLADVLARHLRVADLVETSTVRQGAALEFGYAVDLRPDAAPGGLVAELNQLEGVVGVELRRS